MNCKCNVFFSTVKVRNRKNLYIIPALREHLIKRQISIWIISNIKNWIVYTIMRGKREDRRKGYR
jgi:hypothetical protein